MSSVPVPERLLRPRRTLELSNCDREPIYIPSAIQPHGVLLAVQREDLRIVFASANASEFLGRAAKELLACDLADILGTEAVAAMRAATGEAGAPSPCQLHICLKGSTHARLHARVHCVGDMLCLELERSVSLQHWALAAVRMEAATHNLQRAETYPELCEAAAREMRWITGYDHVMVYRLHDEHGEVVAEERDDGAQPYLHLHYPVGSLSPQGRALYLQQRTWMVPDAACEPVPLWGDPELARERVLDLAHCALRWTTPIHIRPLERLEASLVIPLIDERSLHGERKLLGLILCHHRTPRTLAPEMRSLCDLLGRTISMLIGATERQEQSTAAIANRGRLERLAALLPPGSRMADVLADNPDLLLDPVGATGALIQLRGQTRLTGVTPSLDACRSIAKALQASLANGFVACGSLGKILPEIASLTSVASEALMIALSDSSDDCVLWFRAESVHAVRWGTNPYEGQNLGAITEQDALLGSPAVWTETQSGHSQPWRPTETAIALQFRDILTICLLRHADVRTHLEYYFDNLTKLANRRVLLERLADHLQESPQGVASLVFLAIDRFKMVNDTMGRAAGDDLLVQMARRLTECVGGRHLVVRLGAYEFAVFCEETAPPEAEVLVQAIIDNLQEPFLLSGRPFRCSMSVGVAPASGGGIACISDALHAADSAMYLAKQRGGNQYAVSENPLQATLIRQMQLEQDLFHAVQRGEMLVHFQALISVDRHQLIGFEALLRWTHPMHGPISPSEFIPMAEHTGQIQTIGSWVLGESLRQIRIWRERYIADLFIAVNVSVKQIAAHDFAQRVRGVLAETGVPSNALHLEVTESLLMEPSAEPQLRSIVSLGVKIAIDDFGTGYSSLSYLQRLAVSGVKLDRTFLEDVGKDKRKTALFGAIVRLAHTLGLTVVAEGIEEAAQWECIRSCNCDYAQGYLLSMPIPAATVESLLAGEWKTGLPGIPV